MALAEKCTEYQERWVNIFFTGKEEDGAVCCARCPLLETYARKQCRRTGEYIYEDRTTGYWCPLLKKHNEDLVDPETGELIKIH